MHGLKRANVSARFTSQIGPGDRYTGQHRNVLPGPAVHLILEPPHPSILKDSRWSPRLHIHLAGSGE